MSQAPHGGPVQLLAQARLRCLRAGPLAHAALVSRSLLHAPVRGRRLTVLAASSRVAVLQDACGDLVSVLPPATPLHPWAVTVDCSPATLSVGGSVLAVAADPVPRGNPVPPGGIDASGVAGRSGASVPPGELARSGEPRRRDSRPAGGAILDCVVEPTDLRLPARTHRVPPPGALGALAAAAGTAWADVREPFARVLAPALIPFSERADIGPLADLVGLGEGLTPSGDDILVGVLAGLDLLCTARPGASVLRQALCGLLDAERLARTSQLSGQMLHAARAGLYPEPLLELVARIGRSTLTRGDLPAIERAAHRLSSIGHSSGRAMMWGLLLSMERGGFPAQR